MASLLLASASQAAPVRLELHGSLSQAFGPIGDGFELRDGDPFRITLEFDPVLELDPVGEFDPAREPRALFDQGGFPLQRAEIVLQNASFRSSVLGDLNFSMASNARSGTLSFSLFSHTAWSGQLGGQDAILTPATALPAIFSFVTQGMVGLGPDPDRFPLNLAFSDVDESFSETIGVLGIRDPPFPQEQPLAAFFGLDLEGLDVTVIPEPGTATLLGLGLVGLGLAGPRGGTRRGTHDGVRDGTRGRTRSVRPISA